MDKCQTNPSEYKGPAYKEIMKVVEKFELLQEEINALKEQNRVLIEALGCDNWYNAVSRATKLMRKT